MSRRRRAFALVELLVVIAIITLLTGLLLPSLAAARRHAKSVACRANLKHWGLILAAYTNDNNGCFFRGMVDGWWNDWIEVLEPLYDREEKLTCCPLATRTAKRGGTGVYAAWEDKEGDYGSYGLSAWVCNADPGAVFGDDLYWRRSDVAGADTIPIFLDSRGIAGWPDHSSLAPQSNGEAPQGTALTEQMKNFCIDRHGDGISNSLFMDWSVRKVGLKELWTLKWHRQFNTAGPRTRAGGAKPEDWPQWMRKLTDYCVLGETQSFASGRVRIGRAPSSIGACRPGPICRVLACQETTKSVGLKYSTFFSCHFEICPHTILLNGITSTYCFSDDRHHIAVIFCATGRAWL